MAIFKILLAATALFNVVLSSTAHSSDVESVATSIQLVTSVTFVDPTSSGTTCTTLTVTKSAPASTVTVIAPPAVSGTGAASSAKSSAESSMDVTIQTSVASSVSSKALPTETESCVSSVHTLTHNSQVMTVTGCHLPPGHAPPSAEPTPTLTKTLTSTTSEVETVILPSSSASHDFTGTAIKHSGYPSPPPVSSGNLPLMPSEHSSYPHHINSTMTATATGTGVASASAPWTKPTLPAFTAAADASNVGAALLFGGVFAALFGA